MSSKKCRDNQVLNTKTNRCVSKTGRIGKSLLKKCRDDQILNTKSKRCVSKTGKIGKKILESKTPKRSSPKRVSPKRVSPKRSSPKRVSPKRSSPKRVSPKLSSPKRSSPKRASPRISHAINKIKKLETVDEIIDELENIDIFAINSNGETVGHLLFKNKELDDEDIRDILRELINEYNYDINAVNSNGESILQIAVYNHKEDLIEFLLEENANFDHKTSSIKSKFRNLNLYDIARIKSDYEDTIEILEKYDLFKGEEAYFRNIE